MAYFEIKEELTKGKVKYAVRVREKNKQALYPQSPKNLIIDSMLSLGR